MSFPAEPPSTCAESKTVLAIKGSLRRATRALDRSARSRSVGFATGGSGGNDIRPSCKLTFTQNT